MHYGIPFSVARKTKTKQQQEFQNEQRFYHLWLQRKTTRKYNKFHKNMWKIIQRKPSSKFNINRKQERHDSF